MLDRGTTRTILARALGVPAHALSDAARLDALLEPLGAEAGAARVTSGDSSARNCELGYFLLASLIEDETGVVVTEHPEFNRLLTRSVGEFIAAVESMLPDRMTK